MVFQPADPSFYSDYADYITLFMNLIIKANSYDNNY